MNDKTKRIILITACCLLCGVPSSGSPDASVEMR